MNPKTFLSKTASVVASLALALGASMVATQPASAASVATNDPSLTGTPYPGGSLDLATPITWDNNPTDVKYVLLICDTARSAGSSHDELFWSSYGGPNGVSNTHCESFKNGQNAVIYNTLPIALPSGIDAINISNGSRLAIAVQTDFLSGSARKNFVSKTLATAWSTQVPSSITGTPTIAVSNGTISATVASITGSNVYNNWYACSSAVATAVNTSSGNFSLQGCTKIYQSQGMGYGQVLSTSFQLAGSFYEQGGQFGYTALSISGKHLIFVQYISGGSGGFAYSASVEYIASNSPSNNQNNQQQSTAQVTRSVERSIPTPVFQAPILNSIAPKMSAGFSSNGGRLVLKDVKPTDITSVTLNGKTVAVVPSKSGAALRIPAGAGAGDLKFTMADGTVIDVPNAVKITVSQVDPKLVDLNNLPNFKAGSVAVPSTIKAALTKNKEVILDSANAKCVGYATSNSAAARARALSRASNVCGIITDMNENIEPLIKVLVNKVVAKKSPVRYQTW